MGARGNSDPSEERDVDPFTLRYHLKVEVATVKCVRKFGVMYGGKRSGSRIEAHPSLHASGAT